MESFYGRYKNALVLMLVLLAQVVLLAMQVRRPAPDMPDGHNVRLWRYLVTSIVTPPERLLHRVGLSVRGTWSNYIDLRHLREQNLDLQSENDRLRLEQASLAEDARQGQRLREMLDFRGQYIDKTLPAQVIGTSGTDQARVIYIDRGSNDGLKVQMPVITPDGIIGKLKNVFPSTSQVLLISDQTSGTGVMLETTRVRGVMKGNASGQPQMINISPDERIKPGEPLMTSGGDQVYPPGLPVGVVDHVVADPDTPYVNVVIKPNANLSRLEEVMVITGLSDKMPVEQEKDLAQSEVDALAQKRAADILSEKLPSLHDPNSPETAPTTTTATGTAAGATPATATAGADGDPARPVRPPQPLHPDRYSPGSAPSADSLTPGAAPPMTHRAPSIDVSAPPDTGAKPVAAGTTAAPVEGSRGSALMSRFPVKPGATAAVTPGPSSGTSSSTSPSSTSLSSPPLAASGSGPSSTRSASAGTVNTAAPKPAASTAAKNPATATAGESTAVPRTPRTTASPTANPTAGPATRSAAGSAAGPRTITPTGTATGTTTGNAPSAAPRRPVAVADDSGGILTPAGMSSAGNTQAVRPAIPKTIKPPVAKPDPGKIQTAPANSAPANPAPGNSGQSAPKQQPSPPPPGGV